MSEVLGVDSRLLYSGLVLLVVAERLVELVVARRNAGRLLARGGVEAGAGHYPAMVVLHAAFLAACLAEVWLAGRPFVPSVALLALAVLAAATALRWWVITTLAGRWTTRVIVLPGETPVTGGPFRYLRHPNYLAVIAEIAALPLVHTAWLTALVFSAANGVLLAVRIRAEEAAWARASDYAARFAGRSRLVPGAPR